MQKLDRNPSVRHAATQCKTSLGEFGDCWEIRELLFTVFKNQQVIIWGQPINFKVAVSIETYIDIITYFQINENVGKGCSA